MKRERKRGEEGRQKVRKGQKRCRQVCDLLKELEGNWGAESLRGKEGRRVGWW